MRSVHRSSLGTARLIRAFLIDCRGQVRITGSAPDPRSGHTAVEWEGGIVIHGGMNMVAEKFYNDVWYLKVSDSGDEAAWMCPVCCHRSTPD